MPSPDWLKIRSGPLEARFLSENGGRMTHLVHDRFGDILVPTAGPEFEPLNWPKAGAYPLFPYHNRLIGAVFTHEGKRHDVLPHPALGTDAQHGPAHRRPWKVASHGSDRIELEIDYRSDADWPFDFHASQSFVISDDGLLVELSMTNTGETSMPGGFGWHPYFAGGFENAAACVAGKVWPVGDAGIPSGEPAVARSHEKLPGEGFTVFFSDWRRATLVTDAGAKVTVTAGPELPHIVAHRTAGYICFEPVSHVAGAFGFPSDTRQASGLFVLQPGEKRKASLRLTLASGDNR